MEFSCNRGQEERELEMNWGGSLVMGGLVKCDVV